MAWFGAVGILVAVFTAAESSWKMAAAYKDSGVDCDGTHATYRPPGNLMAGFSMNCMGTCHNNLGACVQTTFPWVPGYTVTCCLCDPTPDEPNSGDESTSLSEKCQQWFVGQGASQPGEQHCDKVTCANPCTKRAGLSYDEDGEEDAGPWVWFSCTCE